MKKLSWLATPLTLIVILGASPQRSSEKTKNIEVKTHVEQTALWVGDSFQYQIQIIHDKDLEFVLDNLEKEKVTLPSFEVRDIEVRQDDWTADKKRLQVTLLLATYETGKKELKIPSLNFYFFDRSSQDLQKDPVAKTLQTPETRVGLRSTLVGRRLEPRQFKPVIEVNTNRAWTFLLLGLAGLGFVVIQSARWIWSSVHIKKLKTRHFSRRERERWVQSNLSRIKSLALGTPEEVNQFYAEVSRFLREYLGYCLEIDALGLTPEEIESELANAHVPRPLIEKIRDTLSQCDMIRYGKDGMREGLSARDQALRIVENIVAQ